MHYNKFGNMSKLLTQTAIWITTIWYMFGLLLFVAKIIGKCSITWLGFLLYLLTPYMLSLLALIICYIIIKTISYGKNRKEQ